MAKNDLYIVWHEGLETGVSILDEQHHGMVATINSLFYFIGEGWGLQALTPTLSIMQQYAGFHAKTEEGILEKAGYHHIDQHVQRHKDFIADTNRTLREAVDERDPDLLLGFLKKWWTGHLDLHRREYASCLTPGARRPVW